jgi:hypothetical protein
MSQVTSQTNASSSTTSTVFAACSLVSTLGINFGTATDPIKPPNPLNRIASRIPFCVEGTYRDLSDLQQEKSSNIGGIPDSFL